MNPHFPPLNPGVPVPVRRLAGGGGTSGFRPYYVPETVAWWSPRAGITNVSGAASAWTTQYPGGTFTGSQASAPARPTVAAGINGNPSLLFDAAASQTLRNTTTNVLAAGAPRYVLGVGQMTSAAGGTFFSFKVGGAACLCYIFNTGGNTYYYGDRLSALASEATAGAPTFTNPFLIEWELTAGALPVVRVNNVARTLTGSNVASDTGTTGFEIAGNGFAGQYHPGHIADIYIASGIPSVANKALLRAYFAGINGITL